MAACEYPVCDRIRAAPVEAVAVALGAQLAGALPSGFGGMSRPLGVRIGYTWTHLPRKVEASFAILAARMAFSNLEIRL